jgi:hypothetical protein
MPIEHKFGRRDFLIWTPCAALAAAPMVSTLLRTRLSDEANVTPSSEKAVGRGLAWLRKVFNKDGGCGVDLNQPSDIGCSCMVGLAMMASGGTCYEGEHQADLRSVLRFILNRVENMPQHNITSQSGTQLQNKIGQQAHSFFAALYLSQSLGEQYDPKPVKEALRKVVDVIVKTQTPSGDWGAESWAPTLGTVMGWVGLRAADSVGLTVGTAPEKTAQHLILKMSTSLADSHGWMHELYKNASGIRVLYDMEMEDDKIAKKAFDDVLKFVKTDNTPFTQAGGEEFLAFHLITETMLKRGGQQWNDWFPVVRDKLIDVQNKDGSWTGHHCITSRTFCTAASVLVLTSPYRYLPISQA